MITKFWKPYLVFAGIVILALLTFALARILSGQWVLPQYVHVGPLTVHYYGITMALAVGSGWWLAGKLSPRYGISSDQVDSLSLWLVGASFIGARAYHVVSSWEYYKHNLGETVEVWNGGLSIYGALFGGIAVLAVYAYWYCGPRDSELKEKFSQRLLKLFDWLAPSFVLGQIIGRFGNLFNYEAFGYPTNLPWKMFVPELFRPIVFIDSSFFHPVFLYEVLGNIVVFCILLFLLRLRKNGKIVPYGALFFGYIILYNSLRFGLEHLRVDSTFIASGIRLNAVVSSVLVVLGLLGFMCIRYATTQSSATPKS